MLPRRIPKPKNMSDRWRPHIHCNFVLSHESCVPGCDGRPIDVAHGIDLHALTAEFAAQSPKAAEIKAAKRECGM